jgi:hypothetical protein
MRELLSVEGSSREVVPVAALAARLRALGAKVQMCAPLEGAGR